MEKKLASRTEALKILISHKKETCRVKKLLTIIAERSTDEQWMEFISQKVKPNEGLEYPIIKLKPSEAQLLQAGKNLSYQEVLEAL